MERNLELTEISGEPREANIAPALAGSIADAYQQIGATEQSQFR
jgi:hypothetical protein